MQHTTYQLIHADHLLIVEICLFVIINQQIPVHCQRNLDILVTVTDSLGRKFDNFSSLDFQWMVSDRSLATLEDTEDGSIQISTTSTKEGFNHVKCQFSLKYM